MGAENEDALLAEVMARLADGDEVFVIQLLEHFGGRVAHVVRRHLEAMGRRDRLCDVDELAVEACFVIADRAGGWKPDGARPWVWADRAIRSAVARHLGHRQVELEDDVHDLPAPDRHEHAERPYETAVASNDRIRAFDEALREVANERDYEVFVEYTVQQAYDDPSPAHTVAKLVGLRPEHVRQIVCRIRRRLSGFEQPAVGA